MNERDAATAEDAPRGADAKAWWGEFPLESGAWGHWRIGPLDLWVGRTEHQWQIGLVRDDDPFRDECRVQAPVDLRQVPLPQDAEQYRMGYARTSGSLELLPILADRPVVARPDTSFSIPSGERVSVFVSTAVWVRLGCGSRKELLREVPTFRSTDTWFGDNKSGFLSYATRTALRLEVDELPIRPHRAVTPIVIDNQGENTLNIDRISLPIPNLSVFVSRSGALWTERLQLTREDDAELAHVRIDSDTAPLPGAVRLSGPRQVGEGNLLSRVFTGLFG